MAGLVRDPDVPENRCAFTRFRVEIDRRTRSVPRFSNHHPSRINTMIPRIVLFCTLVSLIFPFSPVFAGIVDRSVAIVNDDTITLSEVNELGQSFFKKITAETPPERLSEALYQARLTVIDKLIDKKLLIQEAKKLQVQVSDQDVDNAVQRILANNKATMDQFRKELNSMGMSEKQYREELRDQILSSKLITYEVRTKVVITEEKILDYYNTHYTEQTGAGGYRLRQIGCIWGTPLADGSVPTQEEARDKIQKAHRLARDGKDFQELARQYSDLPTAKDGGNLGLFQKDELAAYIRDAIANLKSGEISPVVETGNSYQIYEVVSTEQGETVAKTSYESVKDQIREKLYQQAMETRFKDWLKSIRDKAYIKIL
ncbi:SurA N-terminal domain-containing protein [Desulfobulbus propionicus]|jgi:peptidyl-prolyl cis-trans isomerase SurA